jgi:hypothetical protein
LLVAGAAEGAAAESAGAAEVALLGELAGGVLSPPHATTAPIAANDTKSATNARFFMLLFLLLDNARALCQRQS